MTGSLATTQRPEKNELRRSIRTTGLVVHYITSVIGVGVLILPEHAAAVAGPISLMAWAALTLYSYPLALVFAKLSMRHPTSRGIAEFIEYAFGAMAGRWASAFLVLTLLVGNPVLGIAAARYLLDIWNPDPGNLRVVGVGALLIMGSIVFNLLGVRISGRVQGAVLAALIGCIVIVMIVSLPKGHVARLDPVAPHGWLALGQAFIICFFGFIGWENAAPVAEEVADPRRTYPRAILFAVLAVGALYLTMSITIMLVLPSGVGGGGRQLTAFATLLQVASGHEISQVGSVVAVVLLLLATNAWVLGTSRVIYSAARDGLLPVMLTKVSRRAGTPFAALLFLIPGYGTPIGILAMTNGAETRLITATSAAFLLIFLATLLAARRLLEGRAIRFCIILVSIATIAILSFVGSSLEYAAALIAIAYALAILRKRRRADMAGWERAGSS